MHKRKNPKPTSRKRPPKGPKSAGTYWIFGVHAVSAALMNPDRRIDRLLVTKQAASSLPDAPQADVVRRETVERKTIDNALSPDVVHQGVAASVHPLPALSVGDLEIGDDALVVVLDQVQDPRNIGAVLRSAAAFGVTAVVVPDRGSPESGGTLAKAAAGTLESVPIVRETNLVRALTSLKDAGFWCIGLEGAGQSAISEIDMSGKTAVVLGGEGRGLRRLTRENCDVLARIPMASGVESLNLSNAAAIALYEARRKPR